MALVLSRIKHFKALAYCARLKQRKWLANTTLAADGRVCSSFVAGKMPTRNKTDFETTNDSLQVNWEDGDQSKYPFIFLRDNCQCEHCFHATAMQRTCDVVGNFSVDIKPESTWLTEDGVTMEWEDGHRSSFPFKWLRERMFPKSEMEIGTRRSNCGLKPITWGSDLIGKIPKYEFGKVTRDDPTLLSWLETVAVTGLTLLENTPGTSESLELIRDKLGCAYRSTHYGERFVVKNKPGPSNLAYTAGYLPLHVDLPFYRYQPGVQVLHCIQQAAQKGGENHFVDGVHIAELLREQEPDAFQLLSSVKFSFQDVGVDAYGDYNKYYERPIIGLDTFGNVEDIAQNNHVRSSFINAPSEKVKRVYEAYFKLVKTMYAPENLVTYKMREGDMLVFNNKRVLHGRAAYEATSPRYLQGCYFDWDEVYSAIRVLRRKLGYKGSTL
eukprot:gene10426-19128_t